MLNTKKLSIYCLALFLLLTQTFLTETAMADSLLPSHLQQASASARLYGSDRYETSVAISQFGWGTSQYVVLARGDEFPDALCAGPLAKKYNAPLLLTQPDTLNDDVLAEIKRLGATHVFIIGGPGAISENVENSLRSAGITDIQRIYGADRYETSVKIAQELGPSSSIFLATGSNYPDALSVSAIAAEQGAPIILTHQFYLPYAVSQYMAANNQITKTYLIGGTSVVGSNLNAEVPGPIRLGGANRYATNALVLSWFADQLNFSQIYLAVGDGPNGNEFADALSGAALAAQYSSPLLLEYKTLPVELSDFIKAKVSPADKVIALGGEMAVPSAVVDEIAGYINNSGSSAPAPAAAINSVSTNKDPYVQGSDENIKVTVNTANVADGTKITAEILDLNNTSLPTPVAVSTSVLSNTASFSLTVPAAEASTGLKVRIIIGNTLTPILSETYNI